MLGTILFTMLGVSFIIGFVVIWFLYDLTLSGHDRWRMNRMEYYWDKTLSSFIGGGCAALIGLFLFLNVFSSTPKTDELKIPASQEITKTVERPITHETSSSGND